MSDANEHSKDDKTYVWVKLRDGTFNPTHTPKRGVSNVTNKKRGAPTNGDATSGDVWGWAPGYYSPISGGNGEERKDGEAAVQSYHFTLLGLDRSGGDGDGADFGTSEHTLTEAATTNLLESGGIVLANAWEQHDFTNRLHLGGDDNDDESDYNYDESDSDSDEDELANTRGVSFMDAPEDSPPTNLIELTHLHEPSVVHALRHRYENTSVDMRNIYTDTGPILLAVNPFKYDESGLLYGDDTVKKYRVEGEERWRKDRDVKAGNTAEGMDTGDEEEKLPPHVYAVADRTFRTMMTRVHPSANPSSVSASSKIKSAAPPPDKNTGPKVNQSVLVSGESGAGKTVTTKLLMAYLSKLSDNPTNTGDGAEGGKPKLSKTSSARASFVIASEGMSIEKRVLESNPIMESFGNARTIRNDNSSRFGKYIEMKFVSKTDKGSSSDDKGMPGATLFGASIETYLLEKVRLVHQSPGERNYHIFYELFSMKYEEEEEHEDEDEESAVEKLGLLDYDMEDFRLINTSDTYDRRDGVADAETFGDLKRAMDVMGFTASQIAAVLEVTSALLHASNLTFKRVGEVECALETDNTHLDYVIDLLGITKEDLNSALCYYEITIGGTGRKGGETHKKVLSLEQCEKGVEALIKATYGALFSYLVQRINASIAGDSAGGGVKSAKSHRGAAKEASIGILDIFGFESFQTNSFEQLCINYCNEALQQQFNGFVLRNEQEEYDREGIPWSFIEFPENQDVLDLIDLKGTGILNMLHDQCRTPGASDKSFALLMYEKCSQHKRFEADSRQVAEQLFGVHHYAGLVEYDIEGFVEKNRDELPKSGSDLLLGSKNDFVKTLAEILQPPALNGKKAMMSPRSGKGQRPTVGIQFSSQLQSLRCKIDDTSPHYIRCLKPNNLLVPDRFDAALIADQLRCAGVIEAVRVSRLGYPQRFTHSQFVARYRILGRKLKKKKDSSKKYNPAKALVHSIMQRPNEPDVGIQVGKTKVFLRRQAYDLLEKLRRERITSATTTIQKIARGYLCRKLFSKALRSILAIQCFVRKSLAQRLVHEMRRQHNSIIVERTWRKYAARKLYISAKVIARWCQTHQRGLEGRRIFNELNQEQKAQYLQSQWRGYVALKFYRKQRNAILIIQCARRCYTSRLELLALKSAARDFSAVVQERDRLRQEAIELRNELQKAKDEANQVAFTGSGANDTEIQEKDAEIQSLRDAFKALSKEKEAAVKDLQELNKELDSLKSERDSAVQDHNDLEEVNKLLQKEMTSQEEEVRGMKEELAEAKKSSNVQEVQSAKAVSTDTTQVLELKKELQFLKEANASLQDDKNRLKEENLALLSKTDDLAHIGEIKIAHDESVSQSSEPAEHEQFKENNDALKADNDRLKNENKTLLSKIESMEEIMQTKQVHRLSLAQTGDIQRLKDINAVLQDENNCLKNENSALLSKVGDLPEPIDQQKGTDETTNGPVSNSRFESPNEAKVYGTVAGKKTDAVEKSPATINQSVCTSVTVDMDMSEDEMTKLREENQLLRKQLDLLRANQDFPDLSGEYSYDESVMPESQSSATGNDISANDVPESVLKQICSEVEMVTEEVIIKTRAECESKIAELQREMEDAKAELERTKRLAKYDLDDMNRVNRSLRDDLEAMEQEKRDLLMDLEEKCEEFEALNEDVERFAETFAAQHEELQHLERQAQKLESENQQLKESSIHQKKKIEELEAQQSNNSPAKNATSELALTEITKLWQEVARLKESPSSVKSGGSAKQGGFRTRGRSVNSFGSDLSSEEES